VLGAEGMRRFAFYVKLLPHEKPKLNSIEVNDDPQNPVHMLIDLTVLPDEDLHALARILPKLGGATGPEPDQGEAGGGPGGDLARTAPTEGPKTIRRSQGLPGRKTHQRGPLV
jgi:hypothetical protein